MSDSNDLRIAELSASEARRTLDNQFELIGRKSTAAVEMIKLNFLVAGVIIAAVGSGTGSIPRNLIIAVFPLMASASLAIIAYTDSVVKNPHYGMTIDAGILRSLDTVDQSELVDGVSRSYGQMLSDNKAMLRRERVLILLSMLIFTFSITLIAGGFASGVI